MSMQLWSRVEEKRGVILASQGEALHRLEINGSKARQDVLRILGVLEQGQSPEVVGANSIQTVGLAAIREVRVSPDHDEIEFHAEGGGTTPLKFSTGGKGAIEIAQSVIARTGRPFQEEKQDITAVEAVLPPIIIGVILGFFWALLYGAAGQIAAGEEIEVHGRRAGLKRILLWAAELLGVNGTLVLGAVLGLWVIGWTAMRVVRRPQRTVWKAEPSA